jgi:hypothetical protein
MADLTESLNRLTATVSAKTGERNQKQAVLNDRKRDDWSRVTADHPDHADFIRAVTGAFGKPAFVGVKTDAGDVLMDSRRYDL